MLSLALTLTLAVAISGDSPSSYGAPPQPAYHAPQPAYHASAHNEVAKPYQYQYSVQDDYSGVNFGASETSDSKAVTGSYTVHLPDGRVQTVTYTADDYKGYVAEVKYEGTPVYPEAKPYHAPAPKYTPAPAPK